MKIKPLGDRILIKILKINEVYASKIKGIALPDIYKAGGNVGVAEIIGIGQGYMSEKKDENQVQLWDPLESKVGERIIFNSKAGLGLSDKFRLIRESEIVAKISNDGVEIGDELFDGGDN
jgi:co-chaperonin GroES (HSP10)